LFQLVLKTDADDLCELHRQALSRLSNLTPGDFAVVVRRNRLSATPMSPQSLLEGLTAEVRTKQSHSKAIGFTAKN